MKPNLSDKPGKALLIIDIQEDYTGVTAHPPFPYKDSERLISTVNRLIDEATRKNVLVVYIRQEFAGLGILFSKLLCGGTALPGKPGTEFDQRIRIINDHCLTKPIGDAFSNPRLEKLLNDHRVGEVFLTGLDAEFCVFETAKGALKRGIKVTAIRDGIVLKAEQKWDAILIKYQRKGIRLITNSEF